MFPSSRQTALLRVKKIRRTSTSIIPTTGSASPPPRPVILFPFHAFASLFRSSETFSNFLRKKNAKTGRVSISPHSLDRLTLTARLLRNKKIVSCQRVMGGVGKTNLSPRQDNCLTACRSVLAPSSLRTTITELFMYKVGRPRGGGRRLLQDSHRSNLTFTFWLGPLDSRRILRTSELHRIRALSPLRCPPGLPPPSPPRPRPPSRPPTRPPLLPPQQPQPQPQPTHRSAFASSRLRNPRSLDPLDVCVIGVSVRVRVCVCVYVFSLGRREGETRNSASKHVCVCQTETNQYRWRARGIGSSQG